jgi:site-specific DNA-methyltransferase (adenine-specific)
VKDILLKSDSDEWETPQDLYDQLNQEFDFTLDPCSSDDNHKTVLYYTKQENGLKQSWGGVPSVLQSTIQRGETVGAESIP